MKTKTMQGPVEKLLRSAKRKISDPKRWTKRSYAKSANGRSVNYHSHKAVRWCALGAVYCVGHRTKGPVQHAEQILHRVAATKFASGAVTVNDQLGHSSVMELYNLAIARAQAAGV